MHSQEINRKGANAEDEGEDTGLEGGKQHIPKVTRDLPHIR